MKTAYVAFAMFAIVSMATTLLPRVEAQSAEEPMLMPRVEMSKPQSRVGLKTDDEVIEREKEQMSNDGFTLKEREMLTAAAEKHEFQAEVNRLMEILIKWLYKEREIFLRELISNGSDALDKIRFLAVSDPKALGEGSLRDLDIRIEFDKDAKTITVTDKGIGMTKEDMIQNLGTVAKSGTTNFLEHFAASSDLSLIGQFGVGFYSVFLVANRVTVTSKHNDDEQYVWESSADGSFTVAKDPRGNTLGRGTRITLHLNPEAEEFLDQDKLRNLVVKYSEFIDFPIYLRSQKTVTKEVPDDSVKEEDKEKEEEEVDVEDQEDEDKDKPKMKKVEEKVWEWELLNENKALWLRKKSEITKEEYNSFYKAISRSSDEPLAHNHFSTEGDVNLKSVLFVPSAAPFDMFENYYGKSTSIKLYVRRVLIAEQFDDLMPKYLNFIKGVVDSDDLPINVSRETLQQNKILKTISKHLVKKALDMIKKMAKEEKKKEEEKKVEEDEEREEEEEEEEDEDKEEGKDTYTKFWEQFGKNIKLGVIEDSAHRTTLSKLLRFPTTKSGDKLVSLETYVAQMKPNQDAIYYIAGESKETVEKSPLLEQLKKRDIEVLLMWDPVDEYAVQQISDFGGKKLQSVSKGEIKFGDESEIEKKKEKAFKKKYQPLLDWFKNLLGDKAEKVVLSKRLADAPCIITSPQWGYSANMERIMRAQAFGKQDQLTFMAAKKTLELNPNHPFIKSLLKSVQEDEESGKAKDMASLLWDSALLNSGFMLDDPVDLSGRMQRVLSASMGLDPDAPVVEDDIPLEEEESETNTEEVKPEEELELDADDEVKKEEL